MLWVLVPKTKRESRAAAGARARVATFPLLRNAINPSSLYVHVFVTSRVVSHFDTNPVEYDNTTTPVKVKVGLFGEEERRGEREREREMVSESESVFELEEFLRNRVDAHELALKEGSSKEAEDHMRAIVSKAQSLAFSFKEASEALHIERTRRETSLLHLEERTQQLQKAQEYSRKYEESFKKASKQQEEAQRRIETQYRDSELRHTRRHDQELKLRTDLEQRIETLRGTEKQLRERLQAERKSREAAEAAQRQMLQRHLQLIKSPVNGSNSLKAEGPLSLGYSLDDVSEITMMNHNLSQAKEEEDRLEAITAQLNHKEEELDKARLSLTRAEERIDKLTNENEEMMESIGLFEMERSSTPIKSGVGQSIQQRNSFGALSVLANSETTLSSAVFEGISSSFDEFYNHLEYILGELATNQASTDTVETKKLVGKLSLSSRERCKLCIEASVSRVLLEILEDDRPLIINGEAHSTHALFEKVSKELTRLRTETETLRNKSQGSPSPYSNKLFEDLTSEFERCQKEKEQLRMECATLKGKLLLATSSDNKVKLEKMVRKLKDENKALLQEQVSSKKMKKLLETKISAFLEKEIAWEKDLKRLKAELKMKPDARRVAYMPMKKKSEDVEEMERERENAIRDILLQSVNKSLAAVAVAKENENGSPVISEEKDSTFENWQAISEFNSRLSEDGVTPSRKSPPLDAPLPTSKASPKAPTVGLASPAVAWTPTVNASTPPSNNIIDLDFPASARSAFSSSTKDALFRLTKMGKPAWHAQSSPRVDGNDSDQDGPSPYKKSYSYRPNLREDTGDEGSKIPKGYLPFVRHTDEALDYAIKNTAAGIHRRLSQARVQREEMISEQVYSNYRSSDRIVPQSPALSSITSSKELHSSMGATDQHIDELSRLKKECERYKRQMFKAEKEAIRARSDLNEVVDELMEVKSVSTPQKSFKARHKTRGPRHQKN